MDEDLSIHRFLLGMLPETEEAKIRARRRSHPGFDELVKALEQELIDDYASETLAPDEVQRFNERYLNSAEGRRSVALAKATVRLLQGRARKHRQTRLLISAIAIAASFVLIAVMVFRRPPPVIAFTLYPGVERSARSSTVIVVPSNAKLLKLDLHPDFIPAGDDVELELVGGGILWHSKASKTPSNSVLSIDLPIANLTSGDYLLSLRNGSTVTNRFQFQLDKP